MSIQRPLLLPALPNLLLHLQGEKHSDCELKLAAWKITQKPGNGRNFKQCSQTGLHIQKTRFYSRSRIGGNKWVSWCCQQQTDRFCAPWSERLNYLSTLFEKDLQYRTINSHRCAISAYHDSQFISAYHDLQLTVVWQRFDTQINSFCGVVICIYALITTTPKCLYQGITSLINLIFINCTRVGEGVNLHQQSHIRHRQKTLTFVLLKY